MIRDLSRLAAVQMRVPDPSSTASFLEVGLGLHRMSHEDGREDLTSEGDYGMVTPCRIITLVPGRDLAVDHVVFELAEPAGAERISERARKSGVDVETDAEVVILRDPDGIELRLAPAEKGYSGLLASSGFRPRRVGHVNLQVTDASASAAFYQDVLGLALSEQVGDLLYFLRVGSEHHNIGLRGGSTVPGVHHIALEVAGWETYRIVCDRLAGMGHVVEYGPGRHGPGRNLFVYLRDPHSGLRFELFSDMARIDDDNRYKVPKWEVGDRAQTVNRWGPGPPESFLR